MDRMNKRQPNLYIIAGPNGAGKTTFARKFLPEYVKCLDFINADLIAGGISPFVPEKAAIQAGRIMIERIRSLSKKKQDFGFESTLSGRSFVSLLQELKEKGYRLHLFFLWLPSADLAIERIADRVRHGGHNIPETVVRRRFHKGLSNFTKLYQPLLDSWFIMDNSGVTPRMIAFENNGVRKIIIPEIFEEIFQGKGKT
jgi:predicted ABC-type ATPase